MPYEDLIQSIETSAHERMKEIADRARQEAEGILQEVRSREESIKRKHADAAKKIIDIKKIRALSQVKEENKMKINRIKDELFQQAVQEAHKKLDSLKKSPAYDAIFRTLLLEAIAEIGTDNPIIHVSPEDEALCREVLKESGKINTEIVTDLAGSAGVIISSPDGSISVLNTFESRLMRARESLRPEIFSRLFGD
jgi:vacuolar-type H+-ATPase subunit E/Vma4